MQIFKTHIALSFLYTAAVSASCINRLTVSVNDNMEATSILCGNWGATCTGHPDYCCPSLRCIAQSPTYAVRYLDVIPDTRICQLIKVHSLVRPNHDIVFKFAYDVNHDPTSMKSSESKRIFALLTSQSSSSFQPSIVPVPLL
jgi:hypothetical protein